MQMYIVLTAVGMLMTLTLASAIPKPDEHKNRVVDKELSDEKHFEDGEEHNPEYDHEAFLGKEEAREFEELSPEESKEKLALIFDKIDKSKDGMVSQEELQNWIKYVQNTYIIQDTERQWKEHEIEGDTLTWAQYKKRTYGYIDDEHEGENFDYKDMMDRDQRRWSLADKNKDDALTKEEFTDFLHPEEAEHMKDIVIQETLEDIDKDKDGFISEEEYIGDFYPSEEGDDEPEPEWVESERVQFKDHHDLNKDGKLDRQEIMAWIIPNDYDHTKQESEHLIGEADVNEDGVLSKEEVVNKYDLFVGSQATDFGEALTRHDEF